MDEETAAENASDNIEGRLNPIILFVLQQEDCVLDLIEDLKKNSMYTFFLKSLLFKPAFDKPIEYLFPDHQSFFCHYILFYWKSSICNFTIQRLC